MTYVRCSHRGVKRDSSGYHLRAGLWGGISGGLLCVSEVVQQGGILFLPFIFLSSTEKEAGPLNIGG